MSRLQANLLLLLAAFLWGAGNVAQKTVLEDLGPLLTSGLRSLIGAVVVLPALCHELRSAKPLMRQERGGIAWVAVFFCLALGFQQFAYLNTSVTNASFLVNTTVVFTPLLGWLLLREKPGPGTWPAVMMVLCGVMLMGAELNGLTWGDASCLVSAVFYAFWIVLLARVSRKVDRPFTLATAQFALAAIVGTTCGFALEEVSVSALRAAAPELLVLGVFSTGIGFTLQALAQPSTRAADAAIILSAESVFGAIAASALLGEQATMAACVGAAMILGAILLVQLSLGRPRLAEAITSKA